jgi:GDP-L-fucose synthase
LQNSHVMPALIRKMHEAKARDDKEVVIWGTGTPHREFLCSDDMADACIFLMETRDAEDIGELVNIGAGQDVTIRELAELVAKVVGFEGELVFDTTKPDGTPRKLLDVSRLTKLGWRATINLEEGIRVAFQDFLMRSS